MSVIDDIKEKIDIVELVGASGVQLRRTGRSFLGFCPFHSNTRTPAFNVYPETQSFYCFGCGASGTAFDYVMRRQGVDFREALEQLAQRAGVSLAPRSEEEAQLDRERTRLLDLTSIAARYFNYVLLEMQRGQAGRDYVEQRDLSRETVETFQLGYSLDERHHLFTYLTERKGFEPDEVVAAGLAIFHEQRGYYDRFRGRVMFPIRNGKGHVVGFGGRALGDGQPKYLNTPQTLLFDKSHVLYGLDNARDGIRAADATIVVEGYIDVLTAHQHGFRNVVAPLGTALTKGHVAMLKKLSQNIFLALDADSAGQKATLRGLSVLQELDAEEHEGRVVATAEGTVRLENEVNLKIIRMPEGRDPDDVIRADPELWRRLQADAVPVMDFYISAYTAGLDLRNPQGQSAALERLLPLLIELDGVRQRTYIARVEHVVGIRAELILDLLRSRRTNSRRNGERPTPSASQIAPSVLPAPRGANAAPTRPTTRAIGREEHLLALLLRFPKSPLAIEAILRDDLAVVPQLATFFGSDLASLFDQPINRAILRRWMETPPEERPSAGDVVVWVDQLEPVLRDHALMLAHVPNGLAYRMQQEVEDAVRLLRFEQVLTLQKRIRLHIADTEAEPLSTEGLSPQDLLTLLNLYLYTLRTPRRTTTFSDLRDTLGRE